MWARAGKPECGIASVCRNLAREVSVGVIEAVDETHVQCASTAGGERCGV